MSGNYLDPGDEAAARDADVKLAQIEQAIIDDVLSRFGGDQPSVIRSELAAAFPARGLQPPPEQWIDAVASELAQHRTYIVAPGLVESSRRSSPEREDATTEPAETPTVTSSAAASRDRSRVGPQAEEASPSPKAADSRAEQGQVERGGRWKNVIIAMALAAVAILAVRARGARSESKRRRDS